MSGGETRRWVALARILRPRGNKGEVAAELLTDFPGRLATVGGVFIGDAAQEHSLRRLQIKSCWINQNHREQIVFHFEGCASISDAERLRGLDVLLPFEQRVSLPAGQYFITDLMGCSVFEAARAASGVASSPCALAEAPALVGVVSDVQLTGEDVKGTPLLVVDTGRGELLVPLAEDICTRIDVAARRIEVTLPEGLRELNSGG